MNVGRTKTIIVLTDYCTALLAWILFFYFRKTKIELVPFEVSDRFYLGVLLIPFFWLGIYYFFGTYKDIKRWYTTRTIVITTKSVVIGTIVLFFTLILDDYVYSYSAYYESILALFLLQYFLTIIPRLLITYNIVSKIHRRIWGFRTLLIGGSSKAVEIFREIEQLPKGIGSQFVGFVNLNGIDKEIANELPHIGHVDDLERILEEEQIEEVIIALDSTEHEKLKQLIIRIQGRDIRIKIIPDMFDLLSGSVKMSNIFGALLIEVEENIMPFWQTIVKRWIDVVFSVIALIILSPLLLVLAILVKRSSEGPIFFTQERIGKNGVPFQIIKFRTMYQNAEAAGPQLSSEHDPRITPIGRLMRKMRFDEFPQFWNVIKGDMSLVGPRPERQYYIDLIVEKEPQYKYLTKVKPGITSWGQVKFGYAENVEEMIQRMKFDLLYLKYMSLALDFKIMFYTVIIVFKAKGK
jgi:exopolysaccharide biosynthesis polyprenyl glycosylphosphotransferase